MSCVVWLHAAVYPARDCTSLLCVCASLGQAKRSVGSHPALASNPAATLTSLLHTSESLARELLMTRSYLVRDPSDASVVTFDPRFLVFE